ncbi:MAG TPA: dTDP-4-keto-6-deoxy-D-glucose epimerase [Desulfobacterales bacterium]|nr:dTDP-4-keto-6-deoxy-D-glucose epimerase [Desulfobacterales bacterium]
MNRFTIIETPLAGLKIIRRQQLSDTRGFLSRLFCNEELALAGWSKPVAQINHTLTLLKGTIRGMHFQLPPHSERKMVNCLKGEIWDVAVDIRSGSSTFLQWYGINLSAENCLSLMIPEGFAHGFQTLSNDVELIYFHSAAYDAESEQGLNPQDPRLAIDWPVSAKQISDRDLSHSNTKYDFKGVQL